MGATHGGLGALNPYSMGATLGSGFAVPRVPEAVKKLLRQQAVQWLDFVKPYVAQGSGGRRRRRRGSGGEPVGGGASAWHAHVMKTYRANPAGGLRAAMMKAKATYH